ncbi:hypothetical protein Tco_0865070 [Tanacetum coccineum]
MELGHSDELGMLIGKLASSSVFYGRCVAFEEVAKMKEPFDLSKVKGYWSSYKKEHTKARNVFMTATFPFLSKVVADPSAPIKVMLSKKPQSLQRLAPMRTLAPTPSAPSTQVTPATALISKLLSPSLVLWIQNQMLDYGFNFMNTKIYIDNESTICIVKNPVFHSKTKHIEIRHHFIRDSYEKKLIQVIKIHTDQNVADLLTKAFDASRFNFLIASIGLLNL